MMSFLTLLLDYYHREDKKGHLLFIMSFNKTSGLIFLSLLCLISSLAYAEEPVTPTAATPITTTPPGLLTLEKFEVFDTPDDSNGSISLSWKKIDGESNAVSYTIYISRSPDGPFEEACRFPASQNWKTDKEWPFWASGEKENYHYIEINPLDVFPAPSQGDLNKIKKELAGADKEIKQAEKDKKDCQGLKEKRALLKKELKSIQKQVDKEEAGIKENTYYFKMAALSGEQVIRMNGPLKGQAKKEWIKLSLLNNLIAVILFCGLVLWFISHAKKNQNLFLRRINGLNAIEEAVGRATEMGRPVLYQTGITGMDDIACIAATVILGKIAEKVALYDTQIKVPHRDPIVMTVCQEIVKEAYTKSGRPDAYRDDSNFYVTGDQFSYTAAVNGMMMREKPAANFFMGSYAAEALLMAECGTSTGAIQIAGTDSTDQLPFFITTCDYTLIGEEYYAASAYLSREPVLVGTLKAQDVAKGFLIILLVLGTIFALFNLPWLLDFIKDFS
jgi:hypothetical protein